MNPLAWNAHWTVVAAGLFVIVMFRANGTYWLGRAAAAGTARTRYSRLLGSPGYRRAEAWLDRWGAPVVAVSFLTIGVQTLVNLAAGATRMKLRHYLPAVTVGCVLWAIIYSTVGFVGWRTFSALHERSPALAWTLAVLAVGGLAAFVVSRVRRERAA
ncbi:DedA family protein [Aestuariimicrobium ganziense]|uniref:DedA family protein n=1 Tax=Aestuariimicrobium ganziense TaxID=2773677 RepID=UPI002E2B9E81|nr:VTT domain-containing protein [Aestuariimicrobium ganziense]